MSDDALNELLAALEASPNNQTLRAHVVRELLKARRWQEADTQGRNLEGKNRPLGLLAQAWGAVQEGQAETAKAFYKAARQADKSIVDEVLEAILEPSEPLKVPSEDASTDKPPPPPVERRTATFADIGGMEQLKEQIRLNILYPIQRPEMYAAYGKKIGGGLMLYGPPGCGKTHLARATAGEMGASFYIVTLQDVLSKWLGETEKAISGLFEAARSTAPSVIFIDEVDALGAKRSDFQSASIRWTVSQFLLELDGMANSNDKVMVLGATNAPWNVDTALRRPGRFDRVIFVPPPDLESRQQILQIQAKGRKIDPKLNWLELAKKCEYFSGADLGHVVERATERALGEALKTGNMREVTAKDFEAVLKDTRPSTMEWLRRSKNYVNFANQDGVYDDLASYLDKAKIR